jgi:transposase-like protein
MNTRKIAAEYRLAHWTQIMQARTESGLSIKEYCKTSGIQENTYFYWQRKLREAACHELQKNQRMQKIGTKTELPTPSGWITCKPIEAENRETHLTLELGEYRVIIPSRFDPETLAALCRVLKTLC